MSLNKILDSFSKGEIDRDKAKEMIHGIFKASAAGPSRTAQPAKEQQASHAEPEISENIEGNEAWRRALNSLRKSKNIDGILRASSDFVQQLAGSVPGQIEKFRDNILHDVNVAGVTSNIKGMTSKLSIFRSFTVGEDCRVSDNLAVGSQWFAVRLDKHADVRHNKFTAVQYSEVAIVQSDLCKNLVSLSRWANMTIEEAKIEDNRFSRMTFSDVSITESDFTENKVQKSEFSQTVVNGSRIARNIFNGVTLSECEFDGCDIRGLEFENCHFEECTFSGIEVDAAKPVHIANKRLTGRTLSDLRSVEAFLAALDTNPDTEEGNKASNENACAKCPKAEDETTKESGAETHTKKSHRRSHDDSRSTSASRRSHPEAAPQSHRTRQSSHEKHQKYGRNNDKHD